MPNLADEIVRDYLGQLYYFSLKKTSSTDAAEDLTQEIMLEIFTALHRGNHPDDLRAWVWKIARNRYARWADRKHKALRNISLTELDGEISDTPCTIEELSLALGVAVPYLEDEIAPLAEYGLLLKDGNRYKTGIVILSKNVQEKLYDIGETIADKLTPVIKAAIDEIGEHLPADFPQSFEDFKPVLAERLCCIPYNADSCRLHTIRHHDGSEWALMGMEKCEKNAPALEVWGTKTYHQILMLGNRVDDRHLDIDPRSVPSFTWDELAEIMKNSHEDEITAIFDEFVEIRRTTLDEAIPSYLRETAMYSSNVDFRYLVIHRLIDEGYIKLHDDMNKSAMGVYNII